MAKPVVHIVHCVDTEGPLYESLEATFGRLKDLFGLDLEANAETLARLQRREIDLGGREAAVATVVAPHLLAYNDDWAKVDRMLDRIMSDAFRHEVPDSFGNGWIYNWHCLDHVGYETNPRRRDLGFHKVFQRYRDRIRQSGTDAIHFHHHPVGFSRQANHSATHFFSPRAEILEIIARRLIDHDWFPCVNRPGFHAERPDSHWFLEQFIPFDFANQAMNGLDRSQSDVSDGRYGDWRRAPVSWVPYHPSHDDYQVPGDCRRWIARCLNIGTRHSLLGEGDVELAFTEAEAGLPVVLAFTNHDHRDMEPDIRQVRDLITRVAARHPGVDFRYAEARDAMRQALGIPSGQPIALDASIEGRRLSVRASAPTFGPQPFLALKTTDGEYLHDNLDFQQPFRQWSYIFDEATVPLERVHTIGLGVCDAAGNVATAFIHPNQH